MFLASDVTPTNLSTWEAISKDFTYSPLQTKAFHVMGSLFQNFEATTHLLRINNRVYADFYLQAYMLACTSLELLGCCLINAQSARNNLETGLDFAGLNTVLTNGITYTVDDLVALCHLAAHGRCDPDYTRTSRLAVLHIELLDSFPRKLLSAYKDYYDRLLTNQDIRQRLADSSVEPFVHYKMVSGQLFRNPVDYGHKTLKSIYEDNQDIMTIFASSLDWQVFKDS